MQLCWLEHHCHLTFPVSPWLSIWNLPWNGCTPWKPMHMFAIHLHGGNHNPPPCLGKTSRELAQHLTHLVRALRAPSSLCLSLCPLDQMIHQCPNSFPIFHVISYQTALILSGYRSRLYTKAPYLIFNQSPTWAAFFFFLSYLAVVDNGIWLQTYKM